MKSTDENVKVLSRAVLSDARDEADSVKAEAESTAEGVRQRAREEAGLERERILEAASREAERVRSQMIATTQLKARTLELEQREQLLDEVFEKAWQQLNGIQRSSDYEQIAERLLHEALIQLAAVEVQVRADQATQKIFSTRMLEKVSQDLKVKIRLGKPLKQGTGVIAETTDGRRQYDNTLETRLKRMQDALRTPVYRILMGETP
jgi:V/A-type H+-transporting ATPase subunit E